MEETKLTFKSSLKDQYDIEKHANGEEHVEQRNSANNYKHSDPVHGNNSSEEFNYRRTLVKNSYDEYGINEIVSIEFYIISKTKIYILFPLLLIFTVGIIPLLARWNIRLKMYLFYTKIEDDVSNFLSFRRERIIIYYNNQEESLFGS